MDPELALLFFELEVGIAPPRKAAQCVLVDSQSTQIVALDLSDLWFNELKPPLLEGLVGLKRLDLRRNGLTTLPETIGRLTTLKKLQLSGNQLESLPETIGNLTNLQPLNLEGNLLQVLPESIGNLTTVQILNLSENELKHLPRSIVKLKNLRYLDLFGNPHLTLSKEQEAWLGYLKKNGCEVD